MCRMLNISLERSFVLESHDPSEGIPFPSRRKIWSYMSFKKSGDQPLEGGNLFRGFILLSIGCSLLPLKCERMKDTRRLAFRFRHFCRPE